MGSVAYQGAAEDAVTASDLARHFGHWQRRALQTPVYVLHHGRPQFVLASIEFMQALSSNNRPAPTGEDLPDLLDALIDPVLICSPDGVVSVAGRAARLYFGKTVETGARLDAFLPAKLAAHLTTVVARVAESGLAERTEIPGSAARARLELVVEPTANGVVIAGRAAGLADQRDAALGRAEALAAAITVLSGTALLTIGLRGQIVAADDALADITGFKLTTIYAETATERFAAASQSLVRETLEAVITDGNARRVETALLTADGAKLRVSLALAPIHRAGILEAVQAIIAWRDTAGTSVT